MEKNSNTNSSTKMQEENNGFIKGLIEFYKEFIGSTANAVDIIAKIQNDYPEKYEKIYAFQKDPSKLLDLLNDLEEEEKSILLEFFVRASLLSEKLTKTFEYTYEEKKKLANELRDFAKLSEKKFEKLKNLKEEKK